MQISIDLPEELAVALLKLPDKDKFVQQALEAGFAGAHRDLPPITRSLVGVMAGQDLDELDYKRHLEQKDL